MTLTYISCSSDFYTFYVNVPLSLGCMIRKVSAEDIAIRGNGTGLEYMCPTRHFVYIFFNPVFQVSTAKNEINLFNNHILIVAPVTFVPAGAMTPSAEFLLQIIEYNNKSFKFIWPYLFSGEWGAWIRSHKQIHCHDNIYIFSLLSVVRLWSIVSFSHFRHLQNHVLDWADT